jgi:lysocardiolipin and lysophospholipid acyltransferase
MKFILVCLRTIAFSLVWWSGIVLVNLLQFPAFFLLPWRKLYRSWMKVTQKVFGGLLVVLTILFAPLKIIVTGCHQHLEKDTFAPMIANHQIYTDWWYIWLFSYFRNAHGEIKILLIQALSRIPLVGK